MKKIPYLVIALLIITGLSACTKHTVNTAPPSAASQTKEWTREDVIALFQSHRDCPNYVVTDCVLTPDSAYGLIGVIQYTDENGNPCNLAFVEEDGFYHPVGLDAYNGSVIADDSTLTYMGNGTVTLTLMRKNNGDRYDYTMKYSKDGNGVTFTAEDHLRNEYKAR
ncbi:MAG: hypothetical protein ACOX7K_02730 [Oscillospiraceae bacterium]|jgi:hypothetical protein